MFNEAQARKDIGEFLEVAKRKKALIEDELSKVQSSINTMSKLSKKKKLTEQEVNSSVEAIRNNIAAREEKEEAEIAELDQEQLRILFRIDPTT